MKRFMTVATACMASLFFLVTAVSSIGAEEKSTGKFKVGDKALDFTLKDLANNDVQLSSFVGKKAVLLAFTSLRCGLCIEETPHLEEFYKKYGAEGLAVLVVNVDGVDAPTIVETLKDIGITVSFPVLMDPEFTVTDAYTDSAVPLTLVIDRQFIIRYIHSSFSKGTEKLYEEAIRQVLGS